MCGSSSPFELGTWWRFVQGFLEKIPCAHDFHFEQAMLNTKADLNFTMARRGENLSAHQLAGTQAFDEFSELMFVRQFQSTRPKPRTTLDRVCSRQRTCLLHIVRHGVMLMRRSQWRLRRARGRRTRRCFVLFTGLPLQCSAA